ncbi:cupredoxin domain-containing protein [Candidatus Woesearchaeota archaeon]|nr:cupredoxin domain-containing protein [Candidatus Woesearchaeota archaeon]
MEIKCEVCNKEFNSQDALDMHNSAKHDSSSNKESFKISKKTLVSVIVVVLVILISSFFVFGKGLTGNDASLTGKVIAIKDTNVQNVKLFMKNNEYQVEPSVLKRGIPVKMKIDVNSLIGCAKGVVIKDFGIRKSVSKSDNIIEFTPNKIGTISIACFMNMYHGTFIVIE